MDDLNKNINFNRYPPNSNLPKGLLNSNQIKKNFVMEGASMLPKLQDFNQMFRQYANSILSMNETIFPPGHPMYSKENSIALLKEENEKILKENFELKKRLQSKNEFKKI